MSSLHSEQDIPQFLLTTVPGFRTSAEYQGIDSGLRHLPGLVCAAFKNYLLNMESAQEPTEEMVSELEKGYSAIEIMSSSQDPAVQNWVVVEMFHYLNCPETVRRRFMDRLGPKSRELFAAWD